MADLETYAKATGILGGALSAVVVVTGWLTKKSDKTVDATLHSAAMKTAIDGLLVRVTVLEAALAASRQEREELGSPEKAVKKINKLWHWYLTVAKRAILRLAAAQSSDRFRAIRPNESGGHNRISLADAKDDAEDAALSEDLPDPTDDESGE